MSVDKTYILRPKKNAALNRFVSHEIKEEKATQQNSPENQTPNTQQNPLLPPSPQFFSASFWRELQYIEPAMLTLEERRFFGS